MFEFKRVCDHYENMSTEERRYLLTEKATSIFEWLKNSLVSGIDPVNVLFGFILGSVTADGKINEMEYLLIYPILKKVFGNEVDFTAFKDSFQRSKDGKKLIDDYTKKMENIFTLLDEELKRDVVMLCLGVTSIDGKITLKEKRYIRHLCEKCFDVEEVWGCSTNLKQK